MSRMATEQPRAVWCCSTCGAIYHKDYPRCPADGAEVVIAERDPLLGTQIGHYTIDSLIGEGGMGRVYLAHHAHLPNKRYAVKVLLGDHAASAQMRARFTREAERASQLDHPNVVKVVDFGQTRHGLLYIVMDHVDGPALVSLIGDVPMAPARVIPLVRAICKGLAHAHAAGIVHRDLKPENILVSTGPDGPVPRIVDFGLALSIDQSDARLTESGMTMGTPAFAAPEQLAGKAIDHRADLYALGMTMFEMLTGGMAPFDGHILEVMSARAARDIPRITERAPQLAIPPELEDVVARLTRRRPLDRYAGAHEVIEALDQVRLGPQARKRTQPAGGTRSRRRWLAAGLAAAVAGGAVTWYAVDAGWVGSAERAAAGATPAAAAA
ncbi:MAG TPA: serine/threonine-protein kinase, partial [Kofleriaceae bacterium]|nr:serine/threonine-protein kinase [Kofleriaceae bacterium]